MEWNSPILKLSPVFIDNMDVSVHESLIFDTLLILSHSLTFFHYLSSVICIHIVADHNWPNVNK